MKKIKTEGNQVFSIPTTGGHEQLVKWMKQSLNKKKYKIRIRARGPRYDGMHQTCKLEDAEWLAVYIDGVATPEMREENERLYGAIRTQNTEIDELRLKISHLQEDLQIARDRIGTKSDIINRLHLKMAESDKYLEDSKANVDWYKKQLEATEAEAGLLKQDMEVMRKHYEKQIKLLKNHLAIIRTATDMSGIE